jgi:hypothetical protein
MDRTVYTGHTAHDNASNQNWNALCSSGRGLMRGATRAFEVLMASTVFFDFFQPLVVLQGVLPPHNETNMWH